MIPEDITDADMSNPEVRLLVIAVISIWERLERVQKGSLGIKPTCSKNKFKKW